MKKETISRVVVAIMMIATLFMPFMTKALHAYEISDNCITCNIADHENHEGQSEHDCDTCPICLFTFFPFIEAECNIEDNLEKVFTDLLLTPYKRGEYKLVFVPYNLRAPPIP